MTSNDGKSSRRRGQARDDGAVLAEAHAAPRTRNKQVYATGDNRDGRTVYRTTRFYGMVFVAIAEQYQRTHAPVPCDACKEAVFAHSEVGRDHKNPFAILAQLEKPGLLQVDNGMRDSDRLPRVDSIIVELDDGTVLWPKVAEPVSVPASSGASELTFEAFHEELRARFTGREFTSRDVREEIVGAGASTLYDRLRRLQGAGTLIMVGGTRGSQKDPPRFRFAESVPVREQPDSVVGASAVASAPPAIVSKNEFARRLAAKRAELARLQQARERRDGAEERMRLAASEVDRLRTLILEAETVVASARAELAEIGEIDDSRSVALAADVGRDAEILASYEDLVARLTNH